MLIKVHYGHNAYELFLVDSVRGATLNYFSFWRATSKAPGTYEVNVLLCVFFFTLGRRAEVLGTSKGVRFHESGNCGTGLHLIL